MKYTISNITHISTLTCAVLIFTQAYAVEGLSANATATSNYLWRGVEQTNGAAAVAGGIDYAAKSGLYLGTWASTANWAKDMTYELDIYAGFSDTLYKDISYDVGIIYFAYPDEASGDANFSEVYASVTLNNLSLGLAVLTSGDGASAGDSLYANADYRIVLANEADVTFHIGSYSGSWLTQDSLDYSISLNKAGFTLGTSMTNLEGAPGDVKVYVAYSVDVAL